MINMEMASVQLALNFLVRVYGEDLHEIFPITFNIDTPFWPNILREYFPPSSHFYIIGVQLVNYYCVILHFPLIIRLRGR